VSKSKGVILGENHLSDVARGRQVAPGDGHSSRGVESFLTPSDTQPFPPDPWRAESTRPIPTSKHVKSNTVKGVRYANGIGPGSFSHAESARPTAPTMETDFNANVKQPDGPVPMRDRQMPHKGDTSKAQEVAREDSSMGLGDNFPAGGVMDRA
jgi:hypothetical protein